MNAGDHPAAVAAFRRWAFLDPDQAVAHFHLGLAFEELGDRGAARRAYAAARAALQRSGTAAAETSLEGYHGDELLRLLNAKLVDTELLDARLPDAKPVPPVRRRTS